MFCSDGLSDMVEDDEIAAVFASSGNIDDDALPRLAAALVTTANDHGGRDNVTVALVRPRPKRTAGGGLLRRLFRR
jgi:protein phosphatase